MSFLHAWAIALGLAAAVPFVLHLRRRHTDRRVAFPALRYLSRAEDARSRSLVASDVVLLATRIGLLAAIALAAAGPLLGRGGASDHAPTDVALIIDNSASTGRLLGDGLLFDALVARARSSIVSARPEDRVWVFPTVGPPLAAGVSPIRAVEALTRLSLSDGGADLSAAVARASAALPADGDRRREVQLLSDLQRNAFAGVESSGDGTPLVAYAPPPPEGPNTAVGEVILTGGTTVPSGLGQGVIVTPVRHDPRGAGADSAAGDASIRLEVDGRIAGATRTPWGASGSLGLSELTIGPHDGRVEVDPTGARADDIRFFSIQVVRPPSVRFLGPDESFVQLGISTLTDAGRLTDSPTPSLVVIEGAPTGAAVLAREAETLILIPPADPVDLPAFNQLLSELGAGWTARADPGRGATAFSEPEASFSLSGISIRSRYLLRTAGGAADAGDSTILSADDGEPWLVRARGESGITLLLGSPLVPLATDLPAHPAMIPFLEALLVQWSHLGGWPPSDFDAGEPVTLPEWAETVTSPDGETTAVEGGAPVSPARAGVYRVEGTVGGAVRVARFAINVPKGEMDPTPLSRRDVPEQFPGRPVFTTGPTGEDWLREIFRARRGHDAAPWLLAVALALAAVELYLATPGGGRRRRGAGWSPETSGSGGAPAHGGG